MELAAAEATEAKVQEDHSLPHSSPLSYNNNNDNGGNGNGESGINGYGHAKSVLLEELAKDNKANPLVIRQLCRDYPGLIATVGIRVKIWSLLLLGASVVVSDEKYIKTPSYACEEQHVLEADVRRTRSDIDIFKTAAWRACLTNIMQTFCIVHKIQYKQGMNEIAAPFLYLHSPPHGNALTYLLFEAFLFRYLQRYFCQDDSAFLFKAFRLFHILLLFIDPQLADHLSEQQFIPELYAPQWFLTLYSRGLTIPLLLRLWDMMIAVDDPAFTFFIGLALLRGQRSKLLMAESNEIPEIIAELQIKTEEEVDELILSSHLYYKRTPKCFLRYLRICCVNTPELAPLPNLRPLYFEGDALIPMKMDTASTEYDEYRWTPFVEAMAKQSVRQCVMMSAAELISRILPNDVSERDIHADLQYKKKQIELDSKLSSKESNQVVVIDIRSNEEIEESGGGYLPTAVPMDPDFLDRPDSLDKWIQHFDKMKECQICIVDLPNFQTTPSALWRRLLLGEGDGLSTNLINYSQSPTANVSATNIPSDNNSPFKSAEAVAKNDDSTRHAVRLARELQKNGFPYVSVLDGGFPAIVGQLKAMRGKVEPVIINHDGERWDYFLKSSGRVNYRPDFVTKSSKATFFSPSSKKSNDYSNNQHTSKSMLSNLETALSVAKRLGHSYMADAIDKKIQAKKHEAMVDDIPNIDFNYFVD